MTDTQDTKPMVRKKLNRVGITNLTTLIETNWRGRRYKFTPKTEITIDLEKDKKGVHMSRLIEAIAEALEEETQKSAGSIEEIEKHVLQRLMKTHPHNLAEITMRADLIVEKKTPATNKKTNEAHKVSITVVREGENFEKTLSVEVVGNTVCPHSMQTAGYPHIQRAIAYLTIIAQYADPISLEDMIECAEKSFSSEVYTLLKTEDEKHVVRKMHENPKFVEDVVREILGNAEKKFPNARVHAKVISHESIHRHDVVAEGSND